MSHFRDCSQSPFPGPQFRDNYFYTLFVKGVDGVLNEGVPTTYTWNIGNANCSLGNIGLLPQNAFLFFFGGLNSKKKQYSCRLDCASDRGFGRHITGLWRWLQSWRNWNPHRDRQSWCHPNPNLREFTWQWLQHGQTMDSFGRRRKHWHVRTG